MKISPNFVRISDTLVNLDLVASIEVVPTSSQGFVIVKFWSSQNNLLFTWHPDSMGKAAVIAALDKVLGLNTIAKAS